MGLPGEYERAREEWRQASQGGRGESQAAQAGTASACGNGERAAPRWDKTSKKDSPGLLRAGLAVPPSLVSTLLAERTRGGG